MKALCKSFAECRIRVHATERVEGKRNEVKVVLVTDLLVRVDVVVVEHD